MSNPNKQTGLRIRYGILTFFLVLMSVLLGGLVGMLAFYGQDIQDAQTVKAMNHMAILAVACLGITLVLLLGVVIRWVRFTLLRRDHDRSKPGSKYVNIWQEAGRRAKADEENDTGRRQDEDEQDDSFPGEDDLRQDDDEDEYDEDQRWS
jgi:hypothetical protein